MRLAFDTRTGRLTTCLVLGCACCANLPAIVYAQDAPASSLVQALEREESLIQVELKTVRARKTKVTTDSQGRLEALRQGVRDERKRYESSWADVLNTERELRDLDMRLETTPLTPTREDGIAGLSRLEREFELSPEAADDDEARVRRVFEVAGAQLVSASQVRQERRPFFLADGTYVEGTIVRAGAVAAAGVDSSGQGGVLVPTRDAAGSFQVLEPAGQQVQGYLNGTRDTLPLLVFDPQDPPLISEFKNASPKASHKVRTWRNTVQDAAPVGYVILGLGGLAILLVMTRIFALGRLTLMERRVGKRLLEMMHDHHGERELKDLQNYAQAHDSALSRITQQALLHRELPLKLYENSIQASLILELGRVGRGLSALRAIAAVSPLLGLLGTVIGMVATFEALTASGSANDPQALSGGIAQALATTQLGLIVAVPALLAYSSLQGWTSRVEMYVAHIAVEISTHIREFSLADGVPHHHDHAEHS